MGKKKFNNQKNIIEGSNIPDLCTTNELHQIIARLCNKSEDLDNYPNIDTFMDTFREPFILSMAFGFINNLDTHFEIDEDMFLEEMIHTVPNSAIHSQFETIIRVIAYYYEYQKNPDKAHEVLIDGSKLKKIAEAFAIEGQKELENLSDPQFLIKFLEKLEPYLPETNN